MKIDLFLNSRLLNLLLSLFALSFISCKENNKSEYKEKIKDDIFYEDFLKADSISVSMYLPPKKSTAFNIVDKYFHSFSLEFNNKTSKDTIINKKIPRIHDRQVMLFFGGAYLNGVSKFYKHFYLIDKEVSTLNFEYDTGDVHLKNNDSLIFVDSIYNEYSSFGLKINKSNNAYNNELFKELDSIFLSYLKEDIIEKEKILQLNEIHYINQLQKLSPLDNRVDIYIKELKNPIASDLLTNTIFFYVKNRINTFNFNEVKEQNYSENYINLLSIGVFNFLRHEENKGDKKYQPAIDWLRTTDLYKNDSIYIDKEITPINNEEFKNRLKNINLLDDSFKPISFSEILKLNSSDYYLIDFWATWCKPCIEGIGVMKKMQLPSNVAIISLSLDKAELKDRWKIKTKELEQKISYLLKDSDLKNKDFLKFIELQSIPRYIIIDKNMNLIDEAFFHPSEPQFLPKLKGIKYAKFN